MSQDRKLSDFEDVLRNRRTIHKFKTGEIPSRELIIKAIDIARWAPNHHLTEPWHFHLLGPVTAAAIAGLNTQLTRNKLGEKAAQMKHKRWLEIPGWMVLTCDISADPIRSHEDFAACCCAAQNFMLYLSTQGVGVKWTTGDVIREKQFYDLIHVDPEAETVVGIFWYGYAEEIPQVTRKSVDQITRNLP